MIYRWYSELGHRLRRDKGRKACDKQREILSILERWAGYVSLVNPRRSKDPLSLLMSLFFQNLGDVGNDSKEKYFRNMCCIR